MNTFQHFKAMENTRKRKLANNTYLVVRSDGGYGIRLHDTEVIIHYPNNIILNSGGWQTVTTKQRMNEFSTARVWSEKGVWMISWHGEEYAYADGINLDNDGSVCGEGDDPKATQKLRKRINTFAKDYAAAFVNGDIPAPSGGDCWLCMMPEPRSCIESHMDESYFVPRMLNNAADLGTLSLFAKDFIARTWSPDHDSPSSEGIGGIAHDQIRKTIRKYCFKQLGLAS